MNRYAQLFAFAILLPWFITKPAPAVVPPPPSPYESIEYRTAVFDAARIYGKGNCGDLKLAEMTAKHALRTGVPAAIIASVVVVESTCNPLAINKTTGDVGVMQINMAAHAKEYDFTTVNLFNPEDNMTIGTNFLAASIKTYGIRKGVGRYNGRGPNMDAYSSRVLTMAGQLKKIS